MTSATANMGRLNSRRVNMAAPSQVGLPARPEHPPAECDADQKGHQHLDQCLDKQRHFLLPSSATVGCRILPADARDPGHFANALVEAGEEALSLALKFVGGT